MTVSAAELRSDIFIGNDTTVALPFGFTTFAAADLRVVLTDADGDDADLVLDTDYSVALNADQTADPGGTVTLVDPLATGTSAVIISNLAYEQPTDLPEGGNYFASTVERAIDRTVLLVKQLQEVAARTLTISVGSDVAGVDVTLPAPVATELIGWDATGTALTNYAVEQAVVTQGQYYTLLADGDGSTTAFALSNTPASLASVEVFVDGVRLLPTEEYTLSGATVTFVTAPAVGTDNIFFRWGKLIEGAALGDAADVSYTSVLGDAATVEDALLPLEALTFGRTAPHANFSFFTDLFTLTGCNAHGLASVDKDIRDAFEETFDGLISGATSYVAPTGNDAAGGTSFAIPFLTLSQALRSTLNGTIYMWPGTYDLSDFRRTDSNGDKPKRIIAPYGGVILRVVGDLASAATWVLDGQYGGMYSMCISNDKKPIRFLRTDITNQFGDPIPLTLYANRVDLGTNGTFGWAYEAAKSIALTVGTTNTSPTLSCAATLGAAVGMGITGAGIDPASVITAIVPNTSITISIAATATAAGVAATALGNVLYARDAGYQNINTNKARFDIVYGTSAGDNRILLQSTRSYWENITVYGYMSVLKEAGQAVPQVWMKNCRLLYGATHGLLVQGGYAYTQDCEASYGTADGANYNTSDSTLARGIEINFTTRYNGDVFTFGTDQTLNPISAGGTNKNGSSNHDSRVVRINGLHEYNFGPQIADTATSYSWLLGVETGHSALPEDVAPATPRYGILHQNNDAWMDGCKATGSDVSFNADTNADVRIYNSHGTRSETSGGTFTAYAPS